MFSPSTQRLTLVCHCASGDIKSSLDRWAAAAVNQGASNVHAGPDYRTACFSIQRRSQAHQGIAALVACWEPLAEVAVELGGTCVGVMAAPSIREDTVTRWARLALPGEVLWTLSAFQILSGEQGNHWSYCDRTTIEDETGPVELFATRPEVAGQTAATFGFPVVGRRSERQVLEAALGALQTGNTTPTDILLVGDAGMGKTTLVEEACAKAAERGIRQLRTHCVDYTQTRRDQPLGRFLCSLLGLDGKNASPSVLRAAAFQACRQVEIEDATPLLLDALDVPLDDAERSHLSRFSSSQLASRRATLVGACVRAAAMETPLLLTFEDLHWGNAEVVQLLVSLIDSRAGLPIGLLATSRPGSGILSDSPEALQTFRQLYLTPLPLLEARKLAFRLSEQRRKPWQIKSEDFLSNKALERCLVRAGGNPLYLTQLLRLGTTVSNTLGHDCSLDELLAQQMQLLAPKERRLIEVAACIGFYFDAPRSQDLSGSDAADLLALQATQLIRPVEDRFCFSHALIRDAVLSSLTPPQKQAIQQALAEGEIDPMLRAERWADTNDPRAFDTFMAVAEQRRAAFQWFPARDALERAHQVADSPRQHASASLMLGSISEEQGEGTQSLAHYKSALSHLRNGGFSEEALPCLRARLGQLAAHRLLSQLDEAETVIEYLRRHLDGMAQRRAHPLESARFDVLRGAIAFSRGQLTLCQRAQTTAIQTLKQAEPPLTDTRTYAQALSGMGDALYAQGAFQEARTVMEDCISLARDQDFGRIEVSTLHMLGIVTAYEGNPAAGHRLALACWEHACQVGDARAMLFSELNIALTLFWNGRAQDTHAACRGSIERADWLGVAVIIGMARSFTGHIRLASGDRAAATQDVLLSLNHIQTGGTRLYGGVCFGLALALAAEPGSVYAKNIPNWTRKGLEVLDSSVISHNYLYFPLGAAPVALTRGDLATLWRLLTVLRDFFRAEVNHNPGGVAGAVIAWICLHLHTLGDHTGEDDATLWKTVLAQPLLRGRISQLQGRP